MRFMPEVRLLIVEDENIVAKDLRVTLQRLGYEVVETVSAGADAIACAEARRPDLVLMDIALRGEMDGITAAAAIRDRCDIPVVYLTAHADEATLQRAKITEPFGYVLKPFEERELHTAVMMALHKHRLERELRNSREWLNTTLRSIGDAVIATDTDGRVLLMNPVAESLTGWSEADAAGRPLPEVFCILKEHSRKAVENPVDRVLAEGMIVGLANHTLLVSRDGVERPIDDSAAPIRDSGGALLGVVLVFRDVSERRRMERELQEHARQLEEAHRRKDEFLAMLGHELRNPLAPISMGLELLKGPPTDEEVIATMRSQVEHLIRLVDDLLDISRITRGDVPLRKQHVELAAVIARAVEMVRPLINQGEHDLSVSVPDEPMRIEADPVRLTQAFANLLNNAAKYSPRSSPVRMLAQREGDLAVVRVQDEGIGIAPEWLPRVFEMFAQAEPSVERSQGGLGIGLTLVQNLVRMHGGDVKAHSEGVGRGSEFTVSLPLLPEAQRSAEDGAAAAPTSAGQRRRVLIVDDNRAAGRITQLLLESVLGHEVALARDGPAAIECARTFHPHAVVLDIGLPGMSGYEVARRLRTLHGMEKAILIALTGYGEERDRRQALEAGFDHHLVKPASASSLREALHATPAG
ncbi:MAG: response regulator [Planctomycetes bacterium]|nr:response regulator [Planctomycetota bacterium]